MALNESQRILILDFGSQFTQLIARRVREAHVFCEIHPSTRDLAWIKQYNPKGIILSGGPASVYDEGAPTTDRGVFDLGVPVLGVCYGMQLMAHLTGGTVSPAGEREFGRAEIEVVGQDDLFAGFDIGTKTTVWASHGDRIELAADTFLKLASSPNAPMAAFRHRKKP